MIQGPAASAKTTPQAAVNKDGLQRHAVDLTIAPRAVGHVCGPDASGCSHINDSGQSGAPPAMTALPTPPITGPRRIGIVSASAQPSRERTGPKGAFLSVGAVKSAT